MIVFCSENNNGKYLKIMSLLIWMAYLVNNVYYCCDAYYVEYKSNLQGKEYSPVEMKNACGFR